MKISDLYSTKRKKFKDGHYYVITYDQNGKKIGQIRWHSTQIKGESPSEKLKINVVNLYNEKKAKKEVAYKNWREEGYVIPKTVAYTDKNMRFEFSYEVLLTGEDSNGNIIEKWITIQDRNPLTKEEIKAKIDKFVLTDYHIAKLKKHRTKNLILSKSSDYKQSYKNLSKKNVRRVKNASST